MPHRLLAVLLALASVSFAQRRVDPRNTYVRVICVVPFTGDGTKASPKAPKYVPVALASPTAASAAQQNAAPAGSAAAAAPSRALPSDIIAFTRQISDDGKYASDASRSRLWLEPRLPREPEVLGDAGGRKIFPVRYDRSSQLKHGQ